MLTPVMLRKMSEQTKKSSRAKTIKDAYKRYLQNTQEEITVSKEEFVALNRAFNRLVMNKLLENHKVYLPGNIGMVHIYGIKEKVKFDEEGKLKGLSPNWKLTKELWAENPQAKLDKKVIYNTNEHSSGIRYNFVWSKHTCKIPNRTLYTMRITREYKRKLSTLVFAGKEYDSKTI